MLQTRWALFKRASPFHVIHIYSVGSTRFTWLNKLNISLGLSLVVESNE